MGEDIYMMEEDFSHNDTSVLWNWEDYPIPSGADLCSIRRNIKEALCVMGFRGHVVIWRYGDHVYHGRDELREAAITHFLSETSVGCEWADFKIPLHMVPWAASRRPPHILVVIAKQNPESEWHRVLQCLQSRDHTVLVLEPPDDTAFHSAQSIVGCRRDLIIKSPPSSDFQDFSKRITPVKGDNIIVFWDAVDCPFPSLCSDPDKIYRRIVETLGHRGCRGEMSIWAYVDENNGSWRGEYLRNKTWDSRIYFLPGGASRPQRMLNDITFWKMDSPQRFPYVPKLLVVSDQFRDDTYFFDWLDSLSRRNIYRVLLVAPTREINEPDSPEWPRLLIDEAYLLNNPPQPHEEDAQVFWNLDDYPVHRPSFRFNMEEALEEMGFGWHTNFRAYGDRNHGRAVLQKAGVKYFLPESGYNPAVFGMPLDMITCASRRGPSKFVIIAKQSPESEWYRVLQCLKSRNHTAIVVDDTAQEKLFGPAESVVLRVEKPPISKSPQILEDLSKIQDFSERITPVQGANTVVFWDVVDCPFPPLCSDPDEIYRRIVEALRERGCRDEILVWAYVDEKNGSWSGECLRNKTWDSRIYFLPGGVSRPQRMLHDMYLWEMDRLVDHPNPASLIVVSDQFRGDTHFFNRLGYLEMSLCYRVCVVTPTQHVNKPESPEWPGLLLDEIAKAYLFSSQSERSEPHEEEIIQVFWNSEDYPTPDGFDFRHVGFTIDGALEEMGSRGVPEIWAYGDHVNHVRDGVRDQLLEVGIKYHLPESSGGDNSADFRMPLDMIVCAAASPRGPSRFWVIAKQSPEGELHRVQQCLKSRNHTLLVVDDTTAKESLFHSRISLADCTQVFGGGKHPTQVFCGGERISKGLDSCYSDASAQFDISKMEDFSERITLVGGANTVIIFWDVVDCPFPPRCSNPDEIYRRFDAALAERGFLGEISIWVYVDEKNGSWSGEYLRQKTWGSRIYFLPGGASRCNRMLNDILLWKMDIPADYPYIAHVIVVSDQVREDTLGNLNLIGDGGVFLVTPTRDNNKPESPEWPRLLIEEALLSFYSSSSSSSSSSSEPCPKRHKGDAAEETP